MENTLVANMFVDIFHPGLQRMPLKQSTATYSCWHNDSRREEQEMFYMHSVRFLAGEPTVLRPNVLSLPCWRLFPVLIGLGRHELQSVQPSLYLNPRSFPNPTT